MTKKITIAIDGHSSTGKSTLAKLIAKKYSLVYVDSGAMYRAVTLYAFENQLINQEYFDKNSFLEKLSEIKISFNFNNETTKSEIFLNGVNVESKIRTLEISNLVSTIATVSEVRKKMVQIQQEMGVNGGVVMDGRDIGTVVFPKADLKLFITASSKIRAQRRFDELIAKGDEVTFDEVYQNVVQRDEMDSNREVSPLLKAADAIEIDNSDLSIEQQFNLVCNLVDKKLNIN